MLEVSTIVTQKVIVSYEGYSLDQNSKIWKISREHSLNFDPIYQLLEKDISKSFILILSHYVQKYSAAHTFNQFTRFLHFTRSRFEAHKRPLQIITTADLISYRSTLDRNHEWYLGSLRGFLKSWITLGYSGIDSNVLNLLNNWRLRGNVKGRAIQTLCPVEGPLSDLEFEALHQKVIHAFETNQITIEDFVLVQIFIATGRRPSQLSDLKHQDFIEAQAQNGLQEFILNIPRRKQRGMKWREQFKAYAISKEIGLLIKSLIVQNQARLSKYFNISSVFNFDKCPLFFKWNVIETYSNSIDLKNLEIFLSSKNNHYISTELRAWLDSIVSALQIHSERTGKILRIFPTRLRRTLATRAAREGYGELIIAELLDHTDTQNARIYTENVPEHVDAINEAMARQLAPLAQAFAGMLVDHEKNALRGNNITSRVKSEHGGVGTCGHHGFCGALAPIACYTCRQFQPWLNAPHKNVLDSLMAERQRIFEITQDAIMAAINDRTILAVTEVIQQCEARYNQLCKEIALHD